MKTIVVTDALAADLVAKNEAEYVGNEHVAAALPSEISAVLPPVVQHSENGSRVDQLCPQGTPGTVTLTATGHTLSLPNVDAGEMFPGYCERVWRQAGGSGPDVGLLFQGTGPFFEKFGGFKADGSNWPQAADMFFNVRAYMNDAERATDDKAIAGFAAVGEAIRHQHDAPPAAPTGGVEGVQAGAGVGEVAVEVTTEPPSQA